MEIKFNRHELLTLKAKIKGLAAEGARTHKILKTKSGPERDRYWHLKRKIGVETRHYLIAYAILRGVPYDQIEPNSDYDKAYWDLDRPKIVQIVKDHCPGYLFRKDYTLDKVKEYLSPLEQKKVA